MLKLNIIRVKNEDLYIIAVVIINFAYGIWYDAGKVQFLVCLSIFAGLCFLKILKERIEREKAIYMLFFLILTLVVSFSNRKISLFVVFMCVWGINKVNIERLMKSILLTDIFCFLYTILMWLLGMKNDYTMTYIRLTDNSAVVKHTLGYPNANMLHQAFFVIVLLCVFCYYKKLNVIWYATFFITNYLLYKQDASRTGFYSVIFIVVLTIISKYSGMFFRIAFNSICYCILPTCAVVSLWATITYGKNTLTIILNSLLQTRVFLAFYHYRRCGIHLFGVPTPEGALDAGYINLLVVYGVVFFIVILALFEYSIIYSSKKEKKWMIIIASIAFRCLTEANFISVSVNVAWYLVGFIIIEYLTKKRKDMNGITSN